MDPGEKGAILGTGGPARQEGEKAGSWPQTVEEGRRSGMPRNTRDGLATSPRDVYAQSECYCALCNSSTLTTITGIMFYCFICFRKINHLVAHTTCIHPLMYGKLCRAQYILIICRISDWSQKNFAFADNTLNDIVHIMIICRKKLNS